MFDAAIAAAADVTPHAIENVPLVPGLEVHVDGDYLAYYAAGNDETTPGQARQNALDLIAWFKSRVGAEHAVVHNTGNGSHKGERFLIATIKPYQGHREGGRKPKNHGYLQDWLQSYEGETFRSKTWLTREADDGIGVCSHFATGKAPGYIAIATADKDMRMLPGLHINWKGGQVTRVNPGDFDVIGEDGKQYGLKWFWMQMLMGDTADNIQGVYKLGEKKAEALLKGVTDNRTALGIVLDAYDTAFADAAIDAFCEHAALLWMRCDNHAAIADFAHHAGHSCINQSFGPMLRAGVERLEQRVAHARAEINSFGSGDSSPEPDHSSGE